MPLERIVVRHNITPARDLGWVAGLLEGEGSFFAYGQKRKGRVYTYLTVACNMTDLDVLKELQRISGVGRIYHMKTYAAHHKPAWQWKTTRRDEALELMRAIRPYMLSRRGEKLDALLALDLVPANAA